LEDEGYQVLTADNGSEAIELAREEMPDLVLLDIWMPGLDGLQTLERLKSLLPDLIVVMMSGHGTIETAVKATKLGAYDFVEKPFSLDKVLITIANAISYRELRRENVALRLSSHQDHELVGTSVAVQQLREQVQRVAPTTTPILICGEPGVGKEVVARSIHYHSPRNAKPFIVANCSAIPGELLEGELFGCEQGTGVDAGSQRNGKFDLADSGTIFLDEIHELPHKLQGLLLHILREHQFERPGGNRTVRVNARLIVASSAPLAELVERGLFNNDLFQLLNVVPLTVPPLRERRDDIQHLARHFVAQFHRREGGAARQFDERALTLFREYGWPGNARELKNTVERALIMTSQAVIAAEDIPQLLAIDEAPSGGGRLDDLASFRSAREQFERQFLQEQLTQHSWDIDATAQAIDLDRTLLQRKLLQYGLSPVT
jgi:two-component system nitrogen regulation response regulator NtrX